MSIYPYGSGPLLAVSWQQRLRDAESEAEVVEVVRDFLATFSPYDLARLPSQLRPGRVVDGGDVNDYAFTLVRHNHDDSAGTARCIHRLSNFISSASLRLSELTGTHAVEDASGLHLAGSRSGNDRRRPAV